MSLGDYVRYLRAMRGGISTHDVMVGAGISELRILREIEQRYREVGDDEALDKLATFFEVPVEELKWRRSRSRKALSGFVDQAMRAEQPVRLRVRSGETLTGKVKGWDLGCIELEPVEGGELVIVQRHVVEDWEQVEEPTQ
jgi:hypothetical protein